MQREEMLAKVEAAYHGRRTGDFSKFPEILAEGAAFTFAGDQGMLAAIPGSGGVPAHQVAEELFKKLDMTALERVDAVAEDDRVAILWKTTLVPPGGEPFETMLFDLWEFDGAGKICKGTQFLDTAKLIQVMEAAAEV